MEKKELLNLGFEVKEIKDDSMNFVAYGSATGVKDRDDDVIEKGAYQNVINKAEKTGKYPKLLYQHNYKDVIGVIEGLKEDGKGLLVNGRFIDTTKGRDAYTEVKEGAIDSMSIGFIVGDSVIDRDQVRIIKEVKDLLEISFVTFPANEEARVVQVKQKDGIIDVRGLERHLRDAGLSRNEAKSIISGGISTLKQRDAAISEEKQNIELVSSLDAVIAQIKGSN
jgi:HK97 family phage prohead protease